MKPDDILAASIVGLMLAALLSLVLWAQCLMTEGVEGIARRLYAMLLLLLSAVGVGVVIGVPMFLFAVAVVGGLYVFAAAVGIPFGVLYASLMAAGHASSGRSSLERRNSGNSWFRAHLERIKRVARGKKGQVDVGKYEGKCFPFVVDVPAGSLAERLGVKVNDLILSINDRTLSDVSRDDLRAIAAAAGNGLSATVEVAFFGGGGVTTHQVPNSASLGLRLKFPRE